MKKSSPVSFEAKAAFFSQAIGFQGLPDTAYHELAALAVTKMFVKDDIIFGPEDPCQFFDLVIEGLVRISKYTPTGKRITFLMVRPVEPLNLVGPFTGAARNNVAEVVKDTLLMRIPKHEFTTFAFTQSQLITNIIDLLGQSISSSSSRLMDMVEKKVDHRLKRILFTLTEKFGTTLNFTATEIAELACTTTETSLRILGQLRQQGIIEKSRGQIRILNSEALIDTDIDTFWL